MSYQTNRISMNEALLFVKEVDVLLLALKDGAIIASGLVDGSRRELPPAWWFHISSPLDHTGVVYFYKKDTSPPTPFRAEQIDFLRADLELILPETGTMARSFSVRPERPKATMELLEAWARTRWPAGDLPGRDDLLREARKDFSGVKEKEHIRPLRVKLASMENKIGGAPSHKKPA